MQWLDLILRAQAKKQLPIGPNSLYVGVTTRLQVNNSE